jgi:hypothetical protein
MKREPTDAIRQLANPLTPRSGANLLHLIQDALLQFSFGLFSLRNVQNFVSYQMKR